MLNVNEVMEAIKIEEVSEKVATLQAEIITITKEMQEEVQELKGNEVISIFNDTLKTIGTITEVASIISTINDKSLEIANKPIVKNLEKQTIENLAEIQAKIGNIISLRKKVLETSEEQQEVGLINGIELKKTNENQYEMPLVDMSDILTIAEELGNILKPNGLKYKIMEDKIVITVS